MEGVKEEIVWVGEAGTGDGGGEGVVIGQVQRGRDEGMDMNDRGQKFEDRRIGEGEEGGRAIKEGAEEAGSIGVGRGRRTMVGNRQDRNRQQYRWLTKHGLGLERVLLILNLTCRPIAEGFELAAFEIGVSQVGGDNSPHWQR